MMRAALDVRKMPQRPRRNCHFKATNARKIRRMEPKEFQRMRGTAFDRGRSGPAGLNAAHVDALNDPAVRKQLENLGLQMPPKDKLTPDALGAWQKAEIAKWWPMIEAANVKVD